MMLDDLDDENQFIKQAATRVLSGDDISIEEAQILLNSNHIDSLIRCSNTITRRFNGDMVDIETLINAKSGACPEDCSFCAQSSWYNTGVNKYPLLAQDN